MARAFLSYTRADRSFAARLAIDLMRSGVEVWYDNWEIRAGDSIVEKINAALQKNDYLLVVLSPHAVRSPWVRRELNSSIVASLAGRHITIVPVLKAACKRPPMISDLHYADFTADYDVGFAEVMSALGAATRVPAYTSRPRRVTELDLSNPTGPVRTLFPHTFADWPDCVLGSGDEIDVAIVVGSTSRERSAESHLFASSSVEVDLFGTRWSFHRQESPGTVRDIARVVDLAAYLVQAKLSKHPDRVPFNDTLCRLDINVSSDVLRKNLVLVGAADTNFYFGLASVAYRQKFGYSIPVRYSGDEQLYFTCDQIVSDMSGKTYPRVEDSGYMHCGYLAMVPNPWAPAKVMVLASGTRGTGTQAALLALLYGADEAARKRGATETWRLLSANNRYHVGVPAKIVRATRAEIVLGTAYVSDSIEAGVSPFSRVSQRHVVSDFEFLE